MAEAAFKGMIATLIRQTRPQTFRHGKPPRYPQRSLATAAVVQPQPVTERKPLDWQAHQLTPHETQAVPEKQTRLEKLRNETAPRSFSSFLTDNYSREHNYLRISLTERCNLRCLYCMPEEGIQLSPPDHILTTPEIVYLSSLFVDQGVNKIRLTGGEPTVRKDILDLMRQIGQLRSSGLEELCLTTNGISLHRKLDSMVESGLTGVNLSLDTLDPFQFTIMTRRNGHEAVMKSINRILEMNKVGAGIKLKINCVVMRGLNDQEILPFIELGKDKDLEVRFIEYMPFDGNKWSQKKMLSFDEMLTLIRQKYPDVRKVQDHVNDTSKTYQIPGFVGRIGFITSMTHNFCGTCNRLRITSDGNLKVCLFGNSEVSLRDILRESNDGKPIDAGAMEAIEQFEADRKQAIPGSTGAFGVSEREAKLLNVIGAAVKRKKEKHAGMGELENMKNRPMILIDNATNAQSNHPAYKIHSSPRMSSFPVTSRANTAFTRSIPVHLLSHNFQPSIFQQQRYRSTFLLRRTYITRKGLSRYVWTQPAYRFILHDQLKRVNTRETLECSIRVKNALIRSASKTWAKTHLRTTSSKQASSDDDHHRKPASLSHLTSTGEAHMINVGHKKETHRSATAISYLLFSSRSTYDALVNAGLQKGDAIAVARVAAIQAAKKTADIIPLAHPGLGITAIKVDIYPFPARGYPKNKIDEGDNNTAEAPSQSTSLDEANLENDMTMESRNGGVGTRVTVQCYGKTGVEMEALTAATAGTLTMYDMLKGVDKAMMITGSRVVEKRGGKSGSWRWNRQTRWIEKFDDTSSPHIQNTTLVPNRTTPKDEEAQNEVRDAYHNNNHQEENPSQSASHLSFTPFIQDPSIPANPTPETQTETETAQSVFQAECDTLTTTFTQPTPPLQQPQQPNSFLDTDPDIDPSLPLDTWESTFTTPYPIPRRISVRDRISGNAPQRPNARNFQRERMRRYEEWRRSC